MTKDTSNQMWGGRFAAGPDAIMEAINASIGFDQRMAAQDIAGSRAHAAMLAAMGIVTDRDAEAMREGLPRSPRPRWRAPYAYRLSAAAWR